MPTRLTAALLAIALFACAPAAAAQRPTDDPAQPPAPQPAKTPQANTLSAAAVGREGSRIKFLVDDEATIIDITSPFGIDKATIRRRRANWPRRLRVRLHLTGLEQFTVANGKLSLTWSVASGGNPTSTVSLRRGDHDTVLDADSPFHTAVCIVDGNDTENIPLKRGYFEVPLPRKLLENNPERIELRWIDFYR